MPLRFMSLQVRCRTTRPRRSATRPASQSGGSIGPPPGLSVIEIQPIRGSASRSLAKEARLPGESTGSSPRVVTTSAP